MDLKDKHELVVKILIYSVQFDKDPSLAVDRMIYLITKRPSPNHTPLDYLEGIRAALASDLHLGSLVDQPHSEESLRLFLRALEEKLAPIVEK